MFAIKYIAVFIVIASCQQFVAAQRSPYAGSRPVGYKDKYFPKRTTNDIETNEISNRFGGIDGTQRPPLSGVEVVQGELNTGPFISRPAATPPPSFASLSTSTRLPYDALGDVQGFYILQNLPADQRPFWLLNYQAIEAHKNNPIVGNFNPIASRSSFLGRK